jgi:beta-lactamase class A
MTGISRRRVLIGGSVLLGGAAVAAVAAGPPRQALATPTPDPTTDALIAGVEQAHDAVIGLFAVNLISGVTISHRSQDPFAMCSTFKAYAAARVLQMVERGQLTLDQSMFVDPAAVVANSPRTGPRAGTEMTLSELCQAALQVSDNTAGNLLLHTIGGPSAVTEFARNIGDQRTRLDRWETELNSAIPGDLRDTSTPEALGGGYRTLLAADALGPPQRRLLQDWMRANETSSMRAGLPAGWTTADKTGSGDYGTANDVGIAYGPDGQHVLLAMMTRSQADDPAAETLRPVIGELTELVLPRLTER